MPRHQGEITSIALSPDAKTVATGGRDSAVKIWDAQTGRLERTLRGHTRPVSSLAFSPVGTLLASGSFDRSAKLWDLRSGELKLTLVTPGQVKGMSFSPDGKVLATTSADGVRLWDVGSSRLLQTIPSPRGVVAVAFAPDGRTLATAGALGVRLWDRETGRLLRDLKETTKEISLSVAFSSDGRLLAGGGSNKTARIWDVTTGNVKRRFGRGADFTRSVAFSPNNRTLVVADRRTVRSWDIGTGRLRRSVEADASFLAVAVSNDGTAAGGGADGVPKILKN